MVQCCMREQPVVFARTCSYGVGHRQVCGMGSVRFVSLVLGGLLFAGSAQALECSKAVSPFDKALCADPQARASDERMSKAYSALWALLDAEERQGLLDNQRYWLKYRAYRCPVNDGALAYCIYLNTEPRAKLLEDYGRWARAKPSIRPLFRTKYSFENQYEIIDIIPRLYSGDLLADTSFNEGILKKYGSVISSDHIEFDHKNELFNSEIDEYKVVYVSEKIVSVILESSGFWGGSHGLWEKKSMIYSLGFRRFLNREEMFFDLDNMYVDLERKCRAALLRSAPEIIDEIGKRQLEENIKEHSDWSYVQGGMNIHFSLYTLTSYAGGTQECFIPNRILAKYLRPGMSLAE